ncbi:MAG: hypothetical protein METHAR1v1_310045 [Methanothrix sp.]|nr:MAG: hypothetical protein METHAR1v1_310045 [Methanothrix sp.]
MDRELVKGRDHKGVVKMPELEGREGSRRR